MKKFLLCLLLFCIISAQAVADSAAYYIPPAQMNTQLEIMDNGYANMFALFRNSTGGFTFDETAKTMSNLKIAIDTTSLISNSNENQRDLSNLLGAFQNSEIRITAPDTVAFTDNKAEIKATVMMHGAAKPVTFTATLNRTGTTEHTNSMWSNEAHAVGLSLNGTLKRADFGMTDSANTPNRFGDTLTLRLEAEAVKQ